MRGGTSPQIAIPPFPHRATPYWEGCRDWIIATTLGYRSLRSAMHSVKGKGPPLVPIVHCQAGQLRWPTCLLLIVYYGCLHKGFSIPLALGNSNTVRSAVARSQLDAQHRSASARSQLKHSFARLALACCQAQLARLCSLAANEH